KSSYRQPPQFMRRDLGSGKETRIRFRAVSADDQFSYRNQQIVYSAYEPDLRWGWRDYSVIRLLNLRSGKDIRITRKTKYFSPDISPDGKSVVAVAYPESGRCSLDLLNSKSGEMLFSLPNKENYYYTFPKFFTDQQLVSAVRNQQGEMCLMLIDIPSGKQTILVPWSMHPIGFLSVQNGDIYFTRTENGMDKGFRIRSGKIFAMLPQPATGTYQISAGFGKLAWSVFTAAGFHLNHAENDSLFSDGALQFIKDEPLSGNGVHSLGDSPFQIPDSIPDAKYPVKPYSATTNIFHLHSWRPFINDPDYSFSLVGENVLNTFESEIYVGYNRNEKYKKI